MKPDAAAASRRASSRATRRATTRSRPGHLPGRARRPPRARPASTRRGASRSTRGCRTSRPRRCPRHGAMGGRRSAGLGARPRVRRDRRRAPRARGRADAAASRCAIDERRRRGALGRARRADPDRGDAAARYATASRRPPVRAVRRAARTGATTLRTLLWTRTTLVVPPFTGETDVDLLVPVHVRLRGRPRRSYLDALRRRRGAARVPVQRHGLLRGRRRRAADRADLVGPRGRLPAAGARLARDDGPPLPRQRLAAAGPRRRFDRLAAYKARARAAELGAALDALLRAGRGGRRERDPVRAIADAVLYEGYVLWPYRRSALKNQQRWTFGGVYPRGAQRRASGRRRATMRTECLRRGRRRTRPSRSACASCTWSAPRRARRGRRARARRRARGRRRAPPRLGGGGRARGRRSGRRSVGRVRGRRARDRRRRGSRARGPARRRRQPRRRLIRAWQRARRGGRGRRRARSAARSARLTVTDREHDPVGRAATARRRCGGRSARPTRCCARDGGAFVSLTDPPPDAARERRARARTTARGRCSSASAGATRHAAVLADHPRGPPARSRPRARATSSTAARSTRC